jgi:tetratricopeptide (TPR) repeat protein
MASQTSVSAKEKPKRRWITVTAIGIAVVLVGASILKVGLSSRLADQAEALVADGAFEEAEAKARGALKIRQSNIRAMRVLIDLKAETSDAEAILLSKQLIETGRAEFEDRVQYAELLQTVGDLEGARPIVEELTQERPTDADVILLVARQAVMDGDGDLALLKVEDALSLDEDNLKAKLLRGLLLTESTDPVRRLQGKDGLVDASQSEKRVGVEALMALLSSGNLNIYAAERRSLADRLFNHGLAGISQKLMALQNLIVADPEGRAQYVDRACSLFEGEPGSALLVRWLIAVGEPERALERIPDDIGDNKVYFDARISALMRLGRYDQVSEYVREDTQFLSEIEKVSIQIYLGASGGNVENEEALWSDVFRLAEEEDRADLLISLAQYSQAQGQVERSVACYESAFEIGLGDRDTLALWQQYFLVTLNLSDLEVARGVAGEIYDRYPDDPSSKNNLAYLSLLLGKDMDQAREMSEALVEDHPSMMGFRTTLALALLKTGDADRAWTVLDTDAIDWTQEDGSSRIVVALVAQETGRSTKAREYVADVDPDDVLPAERELLAQIR